jgi:hypothetical protein
VIIIHARRKQLADDLGERQCAVQRPARNEEKLNEALTGISRIDSN